MQVRKKPENPSVTRHALEKYVHRITKPEGDIRAYITNNQERLEEHILRMFANSEFVYRGQMLSNLTQSFYMHRDIVFVVDDVKDNKIITIYNVHFPFPDEVTKNVIDGLKTAVLNGQELLKEDKELLDNTTATLHSEVEQHKSSIKDLEEKINLLRSKITYAETGIEVARKEFSVKNNQVEQYAEQLLGNTSFKKEAEKMQKEWSK